VNLFSYKHLEKNELVFSGKGESLRLHCKILLVRSCRECGNNLDPGQYCRVCMEGILWICNRCGRLYDATHAHPQSNGVMQRYPSAIVANIQ
jgi:hypothetical protein